MPTGSWKDFDPKDMLLAKIKAGGGWVNTHAHIDRAYILDDGNFKSTAAPLEEKWHLPDDFKRKAGVDDIYDHMARAVESMCKQGVQALGTFIDVDPVVEDKAIKAAQKIRKTYKDKIQLKFINQVVKGVIDAEARHWFEIGAEFVDIIGGLPEKDAGREVEHLDILFEAAKKNGGKMLHVHIDQFNSPGQRDTELLVNKTVEHGYQGKVVAVHCISVGAQPRKYRLELYKKMKDAGIMVITCPTGWIDNSWVASQDKDVIGPIHNAIAPVKEMVAAGLTVALGTDNIQDIYKPFSDGDMWTELRFLLESCHFYDTDALAQIASTNGLKVLGLAA
ncbi:MAG TPA: amidohydrolase family protein [Candidatus Saccharimonadales bacterium]|nr:amidohydrolase family protein [Candidatus Saccharimonadales bacterium]